MDRNEFEAIRNTRGKIIEVDVKFVQADKIGNVFKAKDIELKNNLGKRITLDGTYDKRMPKLIFNFSVDGVGPVCRLCVNGTEHLNSGRTHQHELMNEQDPINNLPAAIPYPKLENADPKAIWRWLCQAANITHTGVFHDPS